MWVCTCCLHSVSLCSAYKWLDGLWKKENTQRFNARPTIHYKTVCVAHKNEIIGAKAFKSVMLSNSFSMTIITHTLFDKGSIAQCERDFFLFFLHSLLCRAFFLTSIVSFVQRFLFHLFPGCPRPICVFFFLIFISVKWSKWLAVRWTRVRVLWWLA